MFDYTFKSAGGETRTIAAPNLDTAEKIVLASGFKPHSVVGCNRIGWRDIDQAPKDGTWVLLFSPDSKEPQSFIGQWRDDDENPWGGGWWPDYEAGFPIDADPTHFMPLPAAPTNS